VKPNGNLVLEAKKNVQIGDDEGYTISLTGECRGEDVTPQNTVLSTQVADAEIKVENRGAAKDASQRGWLKKLGDKLRLF
jgi:flagellar L-ring protein precursor FlgH